MFTKTRGLVLVVGAALLSVLGMTATVSAQPNPYLHPAQTWQKASPPQQTSSTLPVQSRTYPAANLSGRPMLPPPANVANAEIYSQLRQTWSQTHPWSPYNPYGPYYYPPYYPCYPYSSYYPYNSGGWVNSYPQPLPVSGLGGSSGLN